MGIDVWGLVFRAALSLGLQFPYSEMLSLKTITCQELTKQKVDPAHSETKQVFSPYATLACNE